MAVLSKPQRKVLRMLAKDDDPHEDVWDEIPTLLGVILSSPEALQEALEIIAGARKIMINSRDALTDDEEMFLMEHDVPPDDHGLCAPFAGHPRILTLEDVEQVASDLLEYPPAVLRQVAVSPSDLVFLSGICRRLGE